MIYAVSVITAVLLTAFFFLYMKGSGYFLLTDNTGEKSTVTAEEENTKEETMPAYNKKQSVLFTVLFFVMAVVTNCFIYNYSYGFNKMNLAVQPMIFPKLAVIHMICACAALTDHKRCKIPNKLLLIGLIARAVVYILEFFLAGEYFTDILKNDALGFVIGFVMLFVVAVVTRGGIGFGDVKLFGVIGITAGSGGVFAVLFLSLLLSSIGSVIMLIMKKKTLKSSMPMAPFIYGGFAAAVILGVF